MRARELPGALALGLLASLAAHGAAYGGGHSIAGPYHAELFGLAAALGFCSLAACAALAFLGAGHVASGSVLAGRLGRYLPGPFPLLGLTCAWFAITERVEPHHAQAPVVSLVFFVVVASLAVRELSRALLTALARVVIGVRARSFAKHTDVWVRRVAPVLPASSLLLVARSYARPPPYWAVGA
jgi:hypothetical protein